jgi:hypothetical protein
VGNNSGRRVVENNSCPYQIWRDSSVSIMTGYGLDYRAIEVRSPAEARGFSSNLYVQIGSGVYPDSCPMSTGNLFPGGNARQGRDADHSPPRLRMSRSCISSPPCASMGVL